MWQGRFCQLGVVSLKNRKLASSRIKRVIIWFSSVMLTSLLSVLITAFVEKINLFVALLLVLKWISTAVLFVLTFRIPVWIIISVVFLVFILVKLIATRKKKPDEPWKQYKMDCFKKWLFEWKYSIRGGIIGLEAICKKCKCLLSSSNERHYHDPNRHLYCPNCDSKYDSISNKMLSDVKKIIINRIESGEYKSSPYFKK